jgi:hypothetical protein
VATGGTTGQLLTKVSGTNYDTTWTTVIPGDRYLTTSSTSLTINNANKTLTIGTGLSYSPQQDVTISESSSPTTRHMHARVTTYDSGTGAMDVDVISHTGSGTYSSWVVNVGGVTPATSVAWGSITGTLSAQTDLQTALDLKYDASNPAAYIDASALSSYAPLTAPSFISGITADGGVTVPGPSGSASFTYSGLTLGGSSGGITFADSTTQNTAVSPYTVNQKKADAIANLIYSQSSNSSGDLSVSNVPQFISNLSTSWGIVDNSATYYNCTGFSGATYSLSGTAGSGPYTVRVNGEDSSFTI